MKKNKSTYIFVGALFIFMIAVIAFYVHSANELSSGDKKIQIEVTDNKENTTKYEMTTDAAFLGDALEELQTNDASFTFSTDSSTGNMMLETINDVKADHENDKTYWALTVDGNTSKYAFNDQPVTDGATYRFTFSNEN